MEIIFLPVYFLLAFPGAGLMPGLLFVFLYFKRRALISRRKRIVLSAAAIIWMVYGVYETYMYFWMQTVIAPIRIDLLVILPFLLLITVIGLIACKRSSNKVMSEDTLTNPD